MDKELPIKNVYSGQENKSKNRERRWKWWQLNSRKHGVAKRKGTGEARAQLGRVTNDRELSVSLYSPGDNAHNWELWQTAPQNWYFPMLLILLQMFPKCWLNIYSADWSLRVLGPCFRWYWHLGQKQYSSTLISWEILVRVCWHRCYTYVDEKGLFKILKNIYCTVGVKYENKILKYSGRGTNMQLIKRN